MSDVKRHMARPRSGVERRRRLRRIARVAGFAILTLVGLELLFVVAVVVGSTVEDIRRPPLCSDLPDSDAAASHGFAERIYARFPLGTPHGEL